MRSGSGQNRPTVVDYGQAWRIGVRNEPNQSFSFQRGNGPGILARKMRYVVTESVKEPIYEEHVNQDVSDGC